MVFKHPTLRYGGYAIAFLTLSIPVSLIISNFNNRGSFTKRFKFFILFVIIVFNFKNVLRIEKEIERGDHYKFIDFPYFALKNKDYKIYQYEDGLKIFSAHHCWATQHLVDRLMREFTLKNIKIIILFISQMKIKFI